MAASKTAVKSTAVSKAKVTNLPVDIKAIRAAEAAAMAARLQAPTGNKIKTDEKMFTLPNGDTADTLSVVIVDFVSQNNYYEGAWNPNAIVPPNCFAIGLEPTGLVPSDNSPDLQAESCAACWANAWKSSPNSDGKACGNTVKLAVIDPNGDPDGPIMELKVTATALKSWGAYAGSLSRAGVVPRDVITTITFDPNVKWSSLRFSDPQPCTDAQMALAYSRREDAMAILTTEPDVSNFVKAAPKAKGRAPVRKAA